VRHLKGEQQLRHATLREIKGRQVKLVVSASQEELIRRQADQLVDEYPDDALEILAADLESDTHDKEGLETARAIAAELRKRAAAGVRKWRGPRLDT
jgi:hypothetical protein